MKKIKTLVILVLLIIVISFIIFITLNLKITRDYPQNIIDLCEKEASIKCEGDCVDGFGEDCYFDSTEYNKDELETGFSFPDKTKKTCLALRSYSVCGECYNKFELKREIGLREVSCEEFFQVIEDRNASCSGCIDIVYSGCC